MSQHLFISHADSDLPWAEWIAWEVKKVGYRATIQSRDFRPGSNLILELDRATREADRVLALLSPAYLEQQTKQLEWATVLLSDPLGREKKLVPVRVQPCLPGGFLAGLLAIDLVGLDEVSARTRLIEGLGSSPIADRSPSFPGSSFTVTKPYFPGIRMPLGNIPHLPNPNFTGRGELLFELQEKLTAGRMTVLTQALSGLGGVGKTQLAVQYAYNHAAEYQFVWWLRAEEGAALASDFAALARHMGLPEKDLLDQRETIAAVRSWLEKQQGWLLVFDNAEEPADLRPYIPRTGSGHVLITSRNPIWRGLADSFVVTPFEPRESLDFLLRATHQKGEEVAASLAEALGHLPLALDQAASYIDATGISVSEYRSLFERYSVRLLERGQPTTDYPATVATTWEISFDRVRRLSPAAEALLNVFAFLGAEAIPRTLFRPSVTSIPDELGEALAEPLAFHDAILALQRYSLISVQPEGFNIHRLVQAVIQDRLREEGERWTHAAAALLDAAFIFDHDDPMTWPECRKLLSHAVAVSNFRQFDLANAAVGHLLWRVGLYLSERADFVDARVMLEEALHIQEKLVGEGHPTLVRALAALALVDQALGRSREAKNLLCRALSIHAGHTAIAPEHRAAILGQMGLVELSLGQAGPARQSFEQALEILQKELAPESPGFAVGLSNLGLALHILGEPDTALECQERALNLLRQSLSARHPTIAVLASNLGLLLLELGREVEAREHLAIAAASDRTTYGTKHPYLAIRMANRALAAEARGENETAHRLLEAALARDEAAFRGTPNPRIAIDLNNLALRRQEKGDLEGARQLLERAFSLLETTWGESHPGLAVVCANLGQVWGRLGEFEDSRNYLKRALHLAETTLGKRHLLTVWVLNHLGGVLAEFGELTSARNLFTRALTSRRRLGKVRPLEQAIIYANQGEVLSSLGSPSEARVQYDHCLRLSVMAGPRGRSAATLARVAIARLLSDSGKQAAAVALLEEAVRGEQTAKPLRPFELAFCLNNLAMLHAADGQTERAKKLLIQALGFCDRKLSATVGQGIRQNLDALQVGPQTERNENMQMEVNPVQFSFHCPANFMAILAGISLGGKITGDMAAGNVAGLALASPVLHTAACPSLQLYQDLTRTKVDIPSEAYRPIDIGTLFVRYERSILQFFVERRLPLAECEELTQDVFLSAFERNSDMVPKDELRWLLRLASLRYQNYVRQAEKRGRGIADSPPFDMFGEALSVAGNSNPEISFSSLNEIAWNEGWLYDSLDDLTLDDLLWWAEEDPLDLLLDRERKTRLRAAIESLPPQMRRTLLLRVTRDLDYKEIAKLLRISVGTVKAHLHLGQQRLRESLGEGF